MSLENRLPEQLGINYDDPVVDRFTEISARFASLRLPIMFLSPEQQRLILPTSELRQGDVYRPQYDENLSPPDFSYGVDYFFGQYKGRPRSVRENAAAAIYEGRQGVELWRIMKSVAFSTPNDPLVIAHLRGDREIDKTKLADILSINEAGLARADVSKLGLEYGTINPFADASVPIRHIFDRDLIDGTDYPNDDVVFTSSGDPRFYVGFDARRYLKAILQGAIRFGTHEISQAEENSERVIARKPIIVVGGDSGKDTARFGDTLTTAITQELDRKNAYFGDRSLPELDLLSDPKLAGSIDTGLYGRALQSHMARVIDKINASLGDRRHPPIVTFSSMAMHGIAGEMLNQVDGIEYVGPKQTVEDILEGLSNQQIEIAHTILLGLPSAYDSRVSAFAGKILDNSLPVSTDVRGKIQEFIKDCKTNQVDPMKFYQIVEQVLRDGTGQMKGEVTSAQGKNVLVILGASELEGFIARFHQVPKSFADIKSGKPALITEEISKVSDNAKVRLVLIQPGQALTEAIVQKTLEPI